MKICKHVLMLTLLVVGTVPPIGATSVEDCAKLNGMIDIRGQRGGGQEEKDKKLKALVAKAMLEEWIRLTIWRGGLKDFDVLVGQGLAAAQAGIVSTDEGVKIEAITLLKQLLVRAEFFLCGEYYSPNNIKAIKNAIKIFEESMKIREIRKEVCKSLLSLVHLTELPHKCILVNPDICSQVVDLIIQVVQEELTTVSSADQTEKERNHFTDMGALALWDPLVHLAIVTLGKESREFDSPEILAIRSAHERAKQKSHLVKENLRLSAKKYAKQVRKIANLGFEMSKKLILIKNNSAETLNFWWLLADMIKVEKWATDYTFLRKAEIVIIDSLKNLETEGKNIPEYLYNLIGILLKQKQYDQIIPEQGALKRNPEEGLQGFRSLPITELKKELEKLFTLNFIKNTAKNQQKLAKRMKENAKALKRIKEFE